MNFEEFIEIQQCIKEFPKSKILASEGNDFGKYKFYLSGTKHKKINQYLLDQESIIMGDGGEATVFFAKNKYSYSSHNFAFESKDERIKNEYLFRIIEFLLPKINYAGFIGSGLKNIDKKYFKKIKVKLVPLKEQKNIFNLINSLDETIKNYELKIKKITNLKLSLINNIFLNKLNYKNFKKTKVGSIPENWKVMKISDVAEIIDPHPSHRAPKIDLEGIPFIGIGDIDERGNISSNKVRKVSEKIFFEHNKRYKVSNNTIGLGRVASIGKVINFKNYEQKITISPTISIIEPKKINKVFLLNLLKSNLIKKQINNLTTGSTRSSLGILHIRNLLIPLPSLEEQNKISLILKSVDDIIEFSQNKMNKIIFLKKSVMQDKLKDKFRIIGI